MHVSYSIHTSTVWRRDNGTKVNTKTKKQRILNVWDLTPLGAKEAAKSLKSLKQKNDKRGMK